MNFQDIAEIQGWTLDTQVGMLLTYIEQQNSPEAFDNFIDEQVARENEKTMYCLNCGDEFTETISCMEEGVGKTLVEVPCCPNCRSANIIL